MKIPLSNGIIAVVDYDLTNGSPTTYSPMYGADGGDAGELTIHGVWLDEEGGHKLELTADTYEKVEAYIFEHHDDDWPDNQPDFHDC